MGLAASQARLLYRLDEANHHALGTDDTVSWQAAWWALVPLSIGAMVQPCGKVLDSNSGNLRFYIRASPVICAVDCAHFLVVLLLGFSVDLRLFARNVKYELNRRFGGEGFGGDSQSAQDSRTARLCLLVISSIPCQTVKLVAMTGIPWTKAWALMFLVSILSMEVFSVLAKSYALPANGSSISIPLPRWRRYLSTWRPVPMLSGSQSILHLALSLHYGISVLVLFAVTWLNGWRVGNSGGWGGNIVLSALAGFVVMTLPPTISHLGLGWLVSTQTTIRRLWRQENLLFLGIAQLVVTIVIPRTFYLFKSWRELVTSSITFANFESRLFMVYGPAAPVENPVLYSTLRQLGRVVVGVFAHCVILSLGLLVTFLVPAALHQFRAMKRILRIATMDEAHAVVVCITTFTCSLLYYSVLYHDAGTYNPTWTGVFG
ncbi:hypothetical protein B0T16DRAFT_409834 [Cercophora newfieldiana]|uniref:Uncharacterized protein n=1 Tax=Cercophora newfieldiana TaxID=92897 RepID=A0AA39YB11_9PEZI|nr:hypothetical protein B0T16DRAFT_409834 [Cercophora newfieldiana]